MIATAELDELSIDAALCGYRMRLRGADRVEAIRRLAARGCTADEIAERVCASRNVIYRLAKRHTITISPPEPDGWYNLPYRQAGRPR